jgi:CHAT domain-containing protein
MFRLPIANRILRRNKSICVLALSGAVLAGCQSQGESVSLETAKNIAADFQVRDFVPPERTITGMRKLLGEAKAIPDTCDTTRARRQEDLDYFLSHSKSGSTERIRRNQLRAYSLSVEVILSLGKFATADDLIRQGLAVGFEDPRGRGERKYGWEQKMALQGQRSRLNSALGNIGDAESALTSLSAERPSYLSGEYDLEVADFHKVWAEAALAYANGDLQLSESLYRSALDHNAVFVGRLFKADRRVIQAGIVRTLLLQNRLIEAEVEIRSALERVLEWSHKSLHHTATTGGLVALFARIMLEQGRVEDAGYLSNLALNMYEYDCAAPESLGIIQARKDLMVIEGARGNWPAVLKQVAAVESALNAQPNQFNQLFGTDLNWAEALIYAGSQSEGFRKLDAALNKATKDFGSGSYAVAEILGIQALGKAHHGDAKTAIGLFSKSLPSLTSAKTSSSETGTKTGLASRQERILEGYMNLLQKTAEQSSGQVGGINIAEELLRIATVSKIGKVQQAFAAVTARSAVKDPELAKLVRQEQDVTEELRSTGETLAYVLSAPKGGVKNTAPETALRKRLKDLRQARIALNNEIGSRFPEFADLTNPKPLDVAGMQKGMNAGQAMVVFHVQDNLTYVWAVPKNGNLKFAKIDLGRKDLTTMVSTLRMALDPGPLQTLSDIPNFDVALAHDLYQRLLVPVKEGWANAKELYVVSDGPLGPLPMSLLVTENGTPGNDGSVLFERYRKVAWLARDLAITQLPSTNTLKAIGATSLSDAKNRRPFVGFGDPFFSFQQARSAKTTELAATRGMPFRSIPQTRGVDSADLGLLPRLPDTRNELQSIAAAMKADPAKDLYLGADANEEKVKSLDLSNYKVVSFATHGLVPGDLNGLDQPALALSAPRVAKVKGDGLLTMNEILALKLDADFAVLSACNTAAADGQGAEAVSGLGRAFLYAGARALLVSNWPVHSGATTKLMTSLFSDISTMPNLTRSDALRRTRVKLIDTETFKQDGKDMFSYAHPIFWAPFTIIGDGGGAVAKGS